MRTFVLCGCIILLVTACRREASKPAHASAKPQHSHTTAAQTKAPAENSTVTLAILLPQIEATQDPDMLVKQIGELGRLDDGSPRVLNVCRRLLAHDDARVRIAVLEELWFFDDISSMTDDLARLLHDDNSDVRALAAERLGEIETPAAVELLIQNLTNTFADVQAACQEALLMAVAERFDTPEQAYQWWEENRDDWFDE